MRTPTEERNDADLLRAAGRGDRSAFAVLVERHHRALVQFVYRFLGGIDRDTAEDIAQDVFLSAWQGASGFQPRARVLSWLLRMAANACLNHKRSRRLRRTVPLSDGEIPASSPRDAQGGESSALARERNELVRRALAMLPPKQRAAIVLRHYHDLPYTEIAEVLEVSVPSVESLLFRARRSLRTHLATPEDQ